MESLKDYLEKLEIENDTLKNQLKDVYIKKVVYFKQDKIVYFYTTSKNIINNEIIEECRDDLFKKLGIFKDIKIKITYLGLNKKENKDIIKMYWNNIFYVLKSICPSISGWYKKVEYMCIEDILKIKIPKKIFYDKLIQNNIQQNLKNIINEELQIDLNIIFEKAIDEEINIQKSILKNEQETIKKVKDLEISNEDEEESYIVNFDEDEKFIYGDNINGMDYKIKDLQDSCSNVCITGDVFDIEIKELKNGKILFIMAITDYTSSIYCKLFLDDMNKDRVLNNISKGQYLKVKGDIIFDNYQKELSLTITSIKKDEKIKRVDKSDVKRVELHAHTQMSSMDALCSPKNLIKQASNWGHKAIAITDHGVVQAFPDAMSAGASNGIKVIYGVEGYLVDDDTDLIVNANDLDFSQEFVVFDIETTGFSNVNDKITEIGAVKIKDFKVVERFSELINPQKDISYKIQELTGITNDMVKDKPTIEEVLPKFLDFCKGSVLVAHNSEFDISFIKEKSRQQGLEFKNESIDTLSLARVLLPDLKRFRLDVICKKLGIELLNHHRAVDDAEATSLMFLKFLEMLQKKGANTLKQVNEIMGKVEYTKLTTNHIVILAKNSEGLKNLYKIISDSHINHFYRQPRILKSFLKKHREGLIIGSACEAGEIFKAVKKNMSYEELKNIIELYDYIEVMPIDNNRFMIENGEVLDEYELKELNKKIIQVAKDFNKIPVATGDVHFLEKHEAVLRSILKYSLGFKNDEEETYLYFRTTDEMLDEFSYLGEELAYEVVVTNTNKIADMIEDIKPIPSGTYPPEIEGSDVELRNMCYKKAKRIYGDPLPEIVEKRLERELNSIIGNGYAVMYIISQKLVTKSLKDGYLVGSRGSVGSSFAATMSDITEVNPLPAHYICENENCKYSYFYEIGEWGSGVDLPRKNCPKCGRELKKDGHDIPFEVFLGFEGDKEPDIDLNFSGEYQPIIHKYTEELFGEGYVYRAGTIGTVAEKTAFGYAKKYIEENNINTSSAEILRLANGCTGVKKTSGQHPGGVMVVPNYKDIYDFTPIQYPANDSSSGVITTHFDYHSISGRILKLDILGHDVPTIIRMIEDITGIDSTKIPLDDKETMSLFTSTKALGVTPEEINCPIGSLAIPEFGTKFVRQMLLDTKPTTFAELVRISGLSHGTDVWLNNAQELVKQGTTSLKEVISTRDDIMNYLIFKGLPPKMAFTIMENVRKGKGLKDEHVEIMKENDVPDWYIWSCKQIKYMFPKAHAVAYVMMSYRLAYCKVHYPEAFYATYFTTKAEDFDANLIVKGTDKIKERIDYIESLGNSATAKEKNTLTVLEVALEMYARKIKILPVDIYKSDAKKFKVVGEKTLLPPMIALEGMGENASINVQIEREKGEFISKEDLRKRTKVSKTVIQILTEHGALDNMSDENQLSLF